MMVDTDYETYAAYIECNEERDQNFPIISSTTLDLDPEIVADLTDQLQSLGANMGAFVQVRHDDDCVYQG